MLWEYEAKNLLVIKGMAYHETKSQPTSLFGAWPNWQPSGLLPAMCSRHASPPEEKCGCGIYGFLNTEDLQGHMCIGFSASDYFAVVSECIGKTIIHDNSIVRTESMQIITIVNLSVFGEENNYMNLGSTPSYFSFINSLGAFILHAGHLGRSIPQNILLHV